MASYSQTDYGTLAKGGFAFGLAMIVLGATGEWAIHSHLIAVALWEDILFFDIEVLGVLVFLLSPFVFGVFLPLVESYQRSGRIGHLIGLSETSFRRFDD